MTRPAERAGSNRCGRSRSSRRFGSGYLQVFRDVESWTRNQLGNTVRHIHETEMEAEMRVQEQGGAG